MVMPCPSTFNLMLVVPLHSNQTAGGTDPHRSCHEEYMTLFTYLFFQHTKLKVSSLGTARMKEQHT